MESAQPLTSEPSSPTTGARLRLVWLPAATLAAILFWYSLLWPEPFVEPRLPIVPGAVILALCLWWGWKIARKERLARTPVSLPVMAFLGATVLSTIFSIDLQLSLPSLLETLALVLFFFLLCDLLLAGWRPETLVDAVLIAVAFMLVRGLRFTAEWYWGWWQLRVPEYPPFLVPFRLLGAAAHPNILAAAINLALPFAFIRLVRAPTWSSRGAYGLFLLAGGLVLFFTRSRAGWVAAGMALAVAAIGLLLSSGALRKGVAGSQLRWSWRVWGPGLAFLVLFAGLLLVSARSSPSEYAMQSGGSISTIGGRTEFWAIAWRNFLTHPLTGSGPSTYGTIYVNAVSALDDFVAPHAHSLYVNVLTENGIVGALALAWLLLAALLALVRARGLGRLAREGLDDLPLGVFAVLVGYLVHGLADVPGILPSNAFVVVALSAVGLHAIGALDKDSRPLSRWTALVFVVPLLLALPISRQFEAKQAMFLGLRQGLGGDWPAASRTLDAAVAADPGLTLGQTLRGYAYGVLADPVAGAGDREALQPALDSYAAALRSGPHFVATLLDAAELLDRAGATEEADRALAAAVERGADQALSALLLADRLAAGGQTTEADRMFQAAFSAEPLARKMAACKRSLACREAAAQFPSPATRESHAHDSAQALLAQGRAQEAIAALKEIPVTSADPSPWLDRAEAHLALGQLAQARYAVRVAQSLQGLVAPPVRLARVEAALDLAEGKTPDAISALEAVGGLSLELPEPLLPGLVLLGRTDEDLAVYRELGRIYTQEGRSSDAARAMEQAATLAALLGAD